MIIPWFVGMQMSDDLGGTTTVYHIGKCSSI
jgi:hypothetical protein